MAKRVVKKHTVRKNELLEISQQLFNERGYDATPISAILEKAGVAKGTFYHYFRSKEDLLDCLVERITHRILEEVHSLIHEPGLTALQRLHRFFVSSSRWKAANQESLRALIQPIFRDENLPLRVKMNRRTRELTLPILTEIVQQGVDEGVFDTEFPSEAADLILGIGFATQEGTVELVLSAPEHPEKWDALVRRIDCYTDAIERVLGARRGSLHFETDASLERFRP